MIKTFYCESDPFIIKIRNEEETIEMFGLDYLDEENTVLVPEELYERYKVNSNEFWKIQEELRKFK